MSVAAYEVKASGPEAGILTARSVTLLVTMVVGFVVPGAVAATSTGAGAQSATAMVSVIIPQITGIEVSSSSHAAISTKGGVVTVRFFEVGSGAVVVRTARRQGRASAFQTVAMSSDTQSTQVVAVAAGGWQTLEEPMGSEGVRRASTSHQREEVTYEIWKF